MELTRRCREVRETRGNLQVKDGRGSDQAGGTRGGENGVGCARRKAGSAERTDESRVAGEARGRKDSVVTSR